MSKYQGRQTSKLQKPNNKNNNNNMADTYQTSGTTRTGEDSYPQTSGTMPASRTDNKNTSSTSNSGPHKSDWMNKLDPRVDSKKEQEYHDIATSGGAGGMPGQTTTTGTPHGMGNTSEVTPGMTRPYNAHPSAMEREAQPQGTFDHRGSAGGGSQAFGGGTIPHTTTDPNTRPLESTGRTAGGDRYRSSAANKLDPRDERDVSGGQRYYAAHGAGAGAGTGQAPMPSMINQGDPSVQDGGRGGLPQQQAFGNGGMDPRVQDGGRGLAPQPVASGGIDPRMQGGGGMAPQQPVGSGMPGGGTMHPDAFQGGAYGTHTSGAYPDTHHTATGGTHGGGAVPLEQRDGTKTQGGGLAHGVKAAAAGIHVSPQS